MTIGVEEGESSTVDVDDVTDIGTGNRRPVQHAGHAVGVDRGDLPLPLTMYRPAVAERAGRGRVAPRVEEPAARSRVR